MSELLNKALLNEEVAFILGAGASKNVGVPLTNEFLPIVYYLAYYNRLEYEKSIILESKYELFQRLEKICLSSVSLFSHGILKNLKSKKLDEEDIDIIIKYFFNRIENLEDDSFCKIIAPEHILGLLSSISNLTVYEEKMLTSFIERLMFLVGRDCFCNYCGSSIEINSKLILFLPSIEDLVSYLDIISLISINEGIKSFFIDFEKKEYKLNQNSLYHVICALMHLTNNYEKNPFRGPSKEPYTTLARYIKGRNAAVITFNYDNVLEKELELLGVDCNYGIELLNTKQESAFCKMYKLHGSLNWWLCKSCLAKFYYVVENLEDYLLLVNINTIKWELKFNCCGNQDFFPIIIPPTMLKYAQDIDLMKLWTSAFESLSKSKTVVIVGYSFPKEDINAINLFKRSVLNNSYLEYIIYINPDPEPLNFLESFLEESNLKNIKILKYINEDGFAEKTIPKIFAEIL